MSDTQYSRRDIYRLVWEQPLSSVAATLGISAGGLAKICDRLEVPYPPRGYWARRRAGHALPRPRLPAAPHDAPAWITFSGERESSRRTRLRKTPEERREELKAAARLVIAEEGLHHMTMKHVAARIGMSEAQAHNYFTRDELLAEITRQELAEMEAARQAAMQSAVDMEERVAIGTRVYLQEVEKRGVMIQDLLALPAVRERLRLERQEKSKQNLARATGRFEASYGLPSDIGHSTIRILTAVSLRAGRILANGGASRATIERLTLNLVAEGNSRVIATWARNGKLPTSSSNRRSRR